MKMSKRFYLKLNTVIHFTLKQNYKSIYFIVINVTNKQREIKEKLTLVKDIRTFYYKVRIYRIR